MKRLLVRRKVRDVNYLLVCYQSYQKWQVDHHHHQFTILYHKVNPLVTIPHQLPAIPVVQIMCKANRYSMYY